jgi:hypothetical protein
MDKITKNIISYKAFDKDFKCREFQYEVGKTYKMDKNIKICNRGFHACENPIEVFNYYSIISTRFARVLQSGYIDNEKEKGYTKICSSKIKIKEELSLEELINCGIKWLIGNSSIPKNQNIVNNVINTDCDNTIIGSCIDFVKIYSNNNRTKIGTLGYNNYITVNGDYAKICTKGDAPNINITGNCSFVYTRGISARILVNGIQNKIISSGSEATINITGRENCVLSTGDDNIISVYGDFTTIDSRGERANINCVGHCCKVKAKKGSWITLTEYRYNRNDHAWYATYVRTGYIDNIHIKENTWYTLREGIFVETSALF